ncbi:hypothetical protein, partial [Gluconacetobacter diazotrophicus]|uniref:hypothetical protein n=1 Tax=Gluconacetobacter diazotrophicus TaxID=33996 RepID=UPI001C81083B
MKKRLAIAAALLFPAHAAFAKDYCNNPDAIQEARTSLSRAYGGTGVGDDLAAVQLSNIEPHPQEDGSIICTGKVVTPKSLFGKSLKCDSSSGCGRQSREAAWPGLPARRSVIRL